MDCMTGAAFIVEGNLVKTVPPKGVIPIFRQSFLDSVEIARSNGTLLTPQHELVTRYCY